MKLTNKEIKACIKAAAEVGDDVTREDVKLYMGHYFGIKTVEGRDIAQYTDRSGIGAEVYVDTLEVLS